MNPHRGILISRIPVDGAAGLIFAVGMVVTVLVAMPQLRSIFALSALCGVLFAPVLRKLHSH